jgi:hypothetical protein
MEAKFTHTHTPAQMGRTGTASGPINANPTIFWELDGAQHPKHTQKGSGNNEQGSTSRRLITANIGGNGTTCFEKGHQPPVFAKQTTTTCLAGAAGEGDILDNPYGHHGPPAPITASQKKWRGEMCPLGIATSHPARELLKEWSQMGCPTQMGHPWMKEEMWEAVQRGPHRSALSPMALKHFAEEAIEKVKAGQATIVEWDSIKNHPPPKLKISPIAAIPHKSRGF